MKKLVSSIGHFIGEYWMLFVPVAILMLLLAALLGLFSGPSKYVRAPAESCTAAYTGNTQVQDVPMTSCAGYDVQMNCTVPITTYTQQTISEVRVQCDFKEWR